MIPKIYYLLRFGLLSFNFTNDIPKFMIFLQFNSYLKMTIKFLTEKSRERYETIS